MLAGGLWGGAIGIFWPLGRIIYAISYYKAAEKRGPGFLLAILSTLVLLIGALVMLVVIDIKGY